MNKVWFHAYVVNEGEEKEFEVGGGSYLEAFNRINDKHKAKYGTEFTGTIHFGFWHNNEPQTFVDFTSENRDELIRIMNNRVWW
jgi:hypothetical protein